MERARERDLVLKSNGTSRDTSVRWLWARLLVRVNFLWEREVFEGRRADTTRVQQPVFHAGTYLISPLVSIPAWLTLTDTCTV